MAHGIVATNTPALHPAITHHNCTLLGYYAARSADLFLTFQNNILVPSLGIKNPKDMMWPICCRETLVRKYHYMLHGDTDECRSHLLLKSQLTPHKENTLFGSKNSLSNLSSQLTEKTFSRKSIIIMPIQIWHPQLLWQPVSFHLISHVPSLALISCP
jgi:hypothetical protein